MRLSSLKKNDLIKDTFIYTLTDGVNKGLSFLIIPWVSHYLMPKELGFVTNYDVLFNILILLCGQVVVNSIPFFFFNKNKEQICLFISNLLLIVLTLSLLFLIIIISFTNLLNKFLQINVLFQVLAVVNVLTALIFNINTILFRLENKVKNFAIMQIAQTFVNIILLILFVVELQLGAYGKILSVVVGSLIMATINLRLLIIRGYLKFKFSSVSVMEALKFGIPLLPHSLSFWIKGGADKIMITSMFGLAVNGQYSMALSIGSVFNVFSQAFTNAYSPYLQKRISKFTFENVQEEKKKIIIQTYQIGGAYVCLGIVSIAFSWLCITYILNSNYIPSFKYTPWILLSQIFNGFYILVVQYVYTAKKTFGLGVITLSGSMLQILITYFCLIFFGPMGAAYGSVLGSMLIFVAVAVYSSKVYEMPWLNVFKFS